MKLPKIRDGPEVRLIPRCQYSKSDILHQALLDPPRRKDPDAITIEQDLGHHARVIGRLAPIFLFIYSLDRRKVQLVHHVGYEIRQVVIRQPLTKARGQQQILFWKVSAKSFCHVRKTGTPSGSCSSKFSTTE